jgi:demethylmenaquinone methyltransferase/2-methoxy-6-polyprenyl-1,4-benzoquinol methylase
LLALAQAVGAAGQVAGVDVSLGMLGQARRRLVRAGLGERVRLLCADGMHLPFPASSFDAAFMSFTLELFEPTEILRALGDCRRVLRSSGRLCVVSLASEGGSKLMLGLYGRAHARFPSWVDCRPIAAADLLQDAGFHVQDLLRRNLWGLPVQIVRAVRRCSP